MLYENHDYYVEYCKRMLAFSTPIVEGIKIAVRNDEIVAVGVDIQDNVISLTLPDFIEVIGTEFWRDLKYKNVYQLNTSNVYKLEPMEDNISEYLECLILPHVTKLSPGQFSNSNLTQVVANELEIVPYKCFYECNKLWNFKGEKVKFVGELAFQGCRIEEPVSYDESKLEDSSIVHNHNNFIVNLIRKTVKWKN